jgi:hypothetical protein
MLDITTLAAWGEFIGGIAVVVSLIYLAGQIRQNSKLLQISATVAIAASEQSSASAVVDDPLLAQTWTIETAEFEPLPEVEQNRLRAFVALQVNIFYRNYYFRKDGVVRDEVWRAQRRLTASLLRRDWTQQVWRDSRIGFSDEFVDYVDGLIREGEAAE